MKTYLKLLALAAVAAIGCASAQAQAPVYSAEPLLTSCFVTNSATITPTNTVMDVSKQSVLNVQITHYASTTCNSNVVYYFTRSVDGISYDTLSTSRTPITLVLNGTTPQVLTTNIQVYGAGYVKLSSIVNASDVTNIYTSLKYGIKIGAP